jgi:RNA polymerase sigma-70 factor, ECF subfamily
MANLNEDFVKWFMPLQGNLLAYILAIGVPPEDADDVLQDAACVVLHKLAEFQAGTNFRAWAYAIVRNESLNYLKMRKRRMLMLTTEALADIEALVGEAPEEASFPISSLNVCMQKLKQNTRDLLHHRYEKGKSVKQIAEEIGRPVDSVYMTFSRIRRALQKCVERRGILEERSL